MTPHSDMTLTQRVTALLSSADLSRTRGYTVASDLAMAHSTMVGRLSAEGTRYRDLMDAERKCRAKAVIQANQRASGADIAHACGYASDSRIHSNFRRWFGVGLREVRRGAVI